MDYSNSLVLSLHEKGDIFPISSYCLTSGVTLGTKTGQRKWWGQGRVFLSFCLWEREKRENQCFNFVCLLALHTLEAKKHKHFSMLSTKFEITPKKKKNYWLGLYTEKRIYCCKHNYEWTIICLLPFFSFGISCTTLWKMIRNKEKCSSTWHISHKYTL